MSVIDSYLDTLFAPYGDSPAMRDARTELRAMMEDKQDALMADGLSEPQAVGQVIAEFGTLEEVAPVLGIEQELSAGEGSGTRDPAGHREPDGQPRLEVEQAHRYAAAVAGNQYLAAIAVPLFVLSPIPLFVLLYVRSVVGDTWWGLPLGLSMILVVVAVGVLLLHVRDTRLRAVAEEIVDGEFVPSRGSREFARRLRAENRTRASRFLGVAVVLWILSAVPLLSTSMIDQAGESAVFLGLVGTLVMVATGLFLWIRGAGGGRGGGPGDASRVAGRRPSSGRRRHHAHRPDPPDAAPPRPAARELEALLGSAGLRGRISRARVRSVGQGAKGLRDVSPVGVHPWRV